MQITGNGSILCGRCHNPYPPAAIGLVGICKPCRDEYVAQQRTLNALRSEITAILNYLPSRRERA